MKVPPGRPAIARRFNRGRDYLWSFTRHRLAGLMWERRPQLQARLLNSYNVGQPWPPKPFVPSRRPETIRGIRPSATLRPLPRFATNHAYAAAAHFRFLRTPPDSWTRKLTDSSMTSKA